MHRLHYIFFILTLFTGFSSTITLASTATGEAITLDLGQKIMIPSNILNETRELLIHVPKEYNQSDQQYPVIYILDGNNHFQHGVTAVGILHTYQAIPDAIVVAIPNNTGKRTRDVTTGRLDFVNFIEKEVITYVEQHYRTTGHRTLFGHSSMGALTLKIFAERIDMFDIYIAASPALNLSSSKLLSQIKSVLGHEAIESKSLYFTVTESADEVKGFTDGSKMLEKFLIDNAPEHFKWRFNYIPGLNHMTTPYPTFFEGLKWAFKNN